MVELSEIPFSDPKGETGDGDASSSSSHSSCFRGGVSNSEPRVTNLGSLEFLPGTLLTYGSRGGKWNVVGGDPGRIGLNRPCEVDVVRGKPVGRLGCSMSSISDMREISRSNTLCGVRIWSKLEWLAKSLRSDALVSREAVGGERRGGLSVGRWFSEATGDALLNAGLE